jgi:hypothetical protein
MSTTTPLAYNTGSTIPDTTQIGDLAVGTTPQNYSGNLGGVPWWMGPDEDLGYVIAHPVPSNTQPTEIPGTFASLGFDRTKDFSDQSFINLSEYVSRKYSTPQTFTSASDASTWLTNNGFWNTYGLFGNLIMNWDIQNQTSYNGFGTIITDLESKSNGAIYNTFTYSNAVTKYIDVNYTSNNTYIMTSSSLNPYLNPANTGTEISIFLWIYPTSDSGIILSEQGSYPPDTGWYDAQIQLSGGTLIFDVWPYTANHIVSNVQIPLYDWSYVGFSYKETSPTGTLTAYVNGQVVGSESINRQTPYNVGDTNLLYALGYPCATNFGTGQSLDGNFRFGAMKVWNYGLSNSQVLSEYNVSKINYTRGLIMDLNATNSNSYPGPGSGIWWDITANGNNGTPSGAVYSAITGGTFVFNGTSDFVSVGQPIASNSSYSISAWINANDLVGARNIVSSTDSPFWCSNGVLYAGVGGSYTDVIGPTLSTNTWYFVSMTFNDTTNTMKLYVNGSLVNSNTNVTTQYNAQDTYIGSHFTITNVSFWDGEIAQVYMYNNEQSAAEVLHLYNATKQTYENSFTITSADFVNNYLGYGCEGDNTGFNIGGSHGAGEAFYGPIFSQNNGGNPVKGNEILNYFNGNGLSVNNNAYMFNVTWGPGSSVSSGVVVMTCYYNNIDSAWVNIGTVDTTIPGWDVPGTNIYSVVRAQEGTFTLPATFSLYIPKIQDNDSWC